MAAYQDPDAIVYTPILANAMADQWFAVTFTAPVADINQTYGGYLRVGPVMVPNDGALEGGVVQGVSGYVDVHVTRACPSVTCSVKVLHTANLPVGHTVLIPAQLLDQDHNRVAGVSPVASSVTIVVLGGLP